MSITREEANKCLKSLMRVLIIKEGDKYRPAKDTSRRDAYRALYEIQEALGTRRIEREEALLENMQDLELALSALLPVSREQVEKVWRGEWKPTESPYMKECKICSVCGYRKSWGLWFRFCPACGAPMTDEAVDMTLKRMEEMTNEPKRYREDDEQLRLQGAL